MRISDWSSDVCSSDLFEANPDILADVARMSSGPWCVGFAAETENLLEYAEAKRRRKGVPLLVGNLAQQAMNADNTELVLFDDAGHTALPVLDKLDRKSTRLNSSH